MSIIDRIKFLLNGDAKALTDKAYQEGYDKCFNGAMKYMIKENK
jgi:hypothetical protein